MMSPVPFEHRNSLLKKEHMGIHILSQRTAIHHHAVVVHNTGIKCPNERFYFVRFLNREDIEALCITQVLRERLRKRLFYKTSCNAVKWPNTTSEIVCQNRLQLKKKKLLQLVPSHVIFMDSVIIKQELCCTNTAKMLA